MKKEILISCSTALFIFLFAYTALSKFLDYNLFVLQMRKAHLPVMRTIAPVLGWVVPALETVLVVGLFSRNFRLKALVSAVGLLLIFEIYIAGMLLANQHLPCTCGGIISKMSWKQHLIFNAVFIGIGTMAIFQIKNYSFFRIGKT